jgi:hypothetical protein
MVYTGLLKIEGNRVSYGDGTEIRAWYCSGDISAILVDMTKENIFAWPKGGTKYELLGNIHEKFSLRGNKK